MLDGISPAWLKTEIYYLTFQEAKVHMKVLARLVPSGDTERGFVPRLSPDVCAPAVPRLPGLQTHNSNLCPHSHLVLFSVDLCLLSFFLSYGHLSPDLGPILNAGSCHLDISTSLHPQRLFLFSPDEVAFTDPGD